jgi:hypothetical protein
MVKCVQTRGDLIIIEARDFLCFGSTLAPSPPPPSPVSKLDRCSDHRKIEKERQFADGRGGRGWAYRPLAEILPIGRIMD